MFILSYILSTSLEVAITYIQYQATGDIPLIYALLAASSLFSLGIELSIPGEAARKVLKESGRHLELYDMVSNYVRSGIYFAVLFGVIAADKGAFMACGCIGMAMVLGLLRM
ncbi:MAG: hypothetical protein IKZ26_06510 [Peptococcaceae bacterium]|nr:hypothetical protein [Peptococcaceae bacterium]